ncbi:MAG: apolipoprotein N-acyltransferase, partial [Omnitrophica bacterium]|nr:apolipoprotein N-acyltransferase [Candidatus Omnitrophota bacterium]
MKPIIFSILSAVLLIVAYPKADLGFLAWFALVPWLFALQKEKPWRAFSLSYLAGLVFFGGILYWISYVSFLGFIVLIAYLALYFAVFGLISSFLIVSGRRSLFNLFLIPCAWVILEYIRSHLFTGFGWAMLGYSQYRNLAIIQISDITGAYGVSFLLVLVNVAIWQIVREILGSRLENSDFMVKILPALICLLFSITITLCYGYFRLSQRLESQYIRVAVVQGNIPQKMKWDPAAR